MQTDPEIAFPVEAVVDTHHMLAVADLLENQLVADVDQIAHAGHFHGKDFFGRLLDRFVSEKKMKNEKIHNTETTFADYFAETEIVFFRVIFANKGRW